MRQFSVQGVIRNGQVVLGVPLDLPNGITVTVTDGACSEEEWKLKQLTVLKRLDLLDDPDWEEKIKADRRAALEETLRELDRMEAERLKISKPELKK